MRKKFAFWQQELVFAARTTYLGARWSDSMKKEAREKGFSLVEILAGMGIIAMLAIVLVPAGAKVLQLTESTRCVSNLRQIGCGILSYSSDNEGRLPGPLQSAQYPYWNWPTQLSRVLVDYLNVDATRQKVGRVDVFICPAFKRVVKKFGDSPVYALRNTVKMDGADQDMLPFGYPCSDFPATFGTNKDFPPMRLADLGRITDSEGRAAQATTWMLKDVDKLGPGFLESLYSLPGLPKKMVHGKHRNALFYDFHVAAVDAEFAKQ